MEYFFIDDDADDQEIFGMAVAEIDPLIRCVFADDGLQALGMLQNSPLLPSCLFIDLNMPRMNGIECLSEIKKNEKLRDIPAYMYSTSSDPKLVEECKRLGAADFIVKPSGLQALTEMLKQIILPK
jgi:CheY-like chemotaxis protein